MNADTELLEMYIGCQKRNNLLLEVMADMEERHDPRLASPLGILQAAALRTAAEPPRAASVSQGTPLERYEVVLRLEKEAAALFKRIDDARQRRRNLGQ